jgi:hypothetical protein
MNHLTETQLNEYLDSELDAPTRAAADSHLSACNTCRQALAELEMVALLLANLPDEPLTRDLAPSVLATLPQPRLAIGWKLVLAAQAGVIFGMVSLVLSHMKNQFQPQTWLAQVISKLPGLQLPVHDFPFNMHFSIPAIDLQASTTSLIFLAASAMLLCGVGNAILLRGKPENK